MFCRKCNTEKAEDAFHKSKKSKTGLQPYCKACVKSYFYTYYRNKQKHYLNITNENRRKTTARNKEYVRSQKNKPCMDCAKIYNFYILDFDHRDPASKIKDISLLLRSNCSIETLKKEISKCDLVCVNCHRMREFIRYELSGNTKTHLTPRKLTNISLKNKAKNVPCFDCGGQFHLWQMDLDHLPNTKKKERIGSLSHTSSTEILKEELLKCEAVCANCHRERTFNKTFNL